MLSHRPLEAEPFQVERNDYLIRTRGGTKGAVTGPNTSHGSLIPFEISLQTTSAIGARCKEFRILNDPFLNQ
jgi:hypothetical protein